jgi:arginyl-tRNA synthetase
MIEKIVKILKTAIDKAGYKADFEIEKVLERPKDYENGDLAFPCFQLSKLEKLPPHHIAIKIREEIKKMPKEIEDIQTVGPYINFFINKRLLAMTIINKVTKEKHLFGRALSGNDKNVMIEFPSPNTNKPLHLGHMRNMAIGESISRILKFNGFNVIRANLNNDRGTHICKSMLAYQKWGKEKTPEYQKIKSDHFVGDYYVKFAKKEKKNPELEQEAQKMLQKWESGDKEVVELWTKMNNWALKGFKETYDKFGVQIDKQYFESEIYKEGREIILKGLEEGIFKMREDGAIIIDLKDEGLDEKVLLRPDGTSIYITQDIHLAKLKFEDYDLDKSIYVTGNEQDYHFKVLFSVLEKMKIASRDKLDHLSYGMVNLPEGRMKSREGTVVDADDLIDDLQKIIKKELKRRYRLKEKEIEERSLKIALAAIKYFLLKVDIKKNMTFNPKESINVEGDTGPYIQYAYARASSIIKKVESIPVVKIPDSLESKEIELILKLNEFEEVVADAYMSMNPSLIANYSYRLAQIFNEFYHSCQVVGSNSEFFRLHLVQSFRQVLKNALYLLGIETLEEM